MKKIIFTGLLLLFPVLTAVQGAEKKNIHYYDVGFPRSGDIGYLNRRCVLDLKTPLERNGFPTLVWFHGGGLTSGEKYFPSHINTGKIAIAAVNYRLSGKSASCPDYLCDAAAAVSWVLKHISEYGGDPRKVYVGGHSAGGYLTVMLALAPGYLQKFGTAPEKIAGFFSISGQMSTHFQILNERRQKNAESPRLCLDSFAPIALARKGTPPILLISGDRQLDMPGRAEENRWLEVRLRRVFGNKNCQCIQLEGFNHSDVLQPGVAAINDHILKKEIKKSASAVSKNLPINK